MKPEPTSYLKKWLWVERGFGRAAPSRQKMRALAPEVIRSLLQVNYEMSSSLLDIAKHIGAGIFGL